MTALPFFLLGAFVGVVATWIAAEVTLGRKLRDIVASNELLEQVAMRASRRASRAMVAAALIFRRNNR